MRVEETSGCQGEGFFFFFFLSAISLLFDALIILVETNILTHKKLSSA